MNAIKSKKRFGPTKAYVLALLLLAMPVGQAFACYTVSVYNNTGVGVTGMWGATGCFEVHNGKTEICETHFIEPQAVKSYDYSIIATAPTVWMYLGGKDGYKTLGFTLPASGGNFRWATTANTFGTPSCDTHYTVVYTDHLLWEATGEGTAPQLGSNSTPVTAGYIYGTDSNADNKCLQAASSSFSNGDDAHLWDHCIKDPDQKNRVWHYDDSTGYIHNVFDPSYCLHKKSSGFTDSDNIHMWKCAAGSNENKQWEYNKNGQHLLRSKANHNFCIVRAGPDRGDEIYLFWCDPDNNTDQKARWKFSAGNNG